MIMPERQEVAVVGAGPAGPRSALGCALQQAESTCCWRARAHSARTSLAPSSSTPARSRYRRRATYPEDGW